VSWRFFVVNRLHGAYGLVNRLGVLDNPVVSDLFVRTYFAYKRLGDPFATLTRRRPDLFRGGHILDVGANVGYTAAVFARALSPGFKVFAFEPEPRNYERLVRALRRLGLAERSEAIHAAVGATDGTIGLWRDERHHAGHRISTDAFRSGRGVATTDTVPQVTIDAFTRDHGIATTVRFIKIDVEGYEPAVCEGMAATIRASTDVCLALEWAPAAIRELGLVPDTVLAFLRANGFVVHALGEGASIEPFDAGRPERHLGIRGYVDLLCARRRLI
jgi:FkbM family methyltransferase